MNEDIKDKDRLKELEDKLNKVESSYKILDKSYCELLKQYAKLEQENENNKKIADAFFWKLTKPLRFAVNFTRKACRFFLKGIKLVGKGIVSLIKDGPKKTVLKTKDRMAPTNDYSGYMKKNFPSDMEIKYQKNKTFFKDITFSIVVPLYNTKEEFLRDMIESVAHQTYKRYQLCLADASDDEHFKVKKICDEYIKKYDWIKYKKLEKNEGIPQNTNEALSLATGEYIVLLDHDDMLDPSALFECMQVIEDEGADFIYSDEMVFKEEISNVSLIHFKPDFSPDTLRSHNYICHLCVFSKELQQKVGLFSEKYNGSQDYDMILRLTEKAKTIVHIPKVLYYWREHEGSVTSDVSVKSYCMDSAKAAIKAHLDRIGLKGEVYDSQILSTYRIEYEIKGDPKVSIIIPNKDHIGELKLCVHSILNKTSYKNIEIVIVENNSIEEETFEYYNTIEQDSKVKVVHYKEKGFNYPALNKFGIENSDGEYILLLNNDTEVITNDWIEKMLMYCVREDVGIVGGMLYYPDDTIQHAGLIVGLGGAAAHAHRHALRGDGGYIHRTAIAQNLSAVTGACLMTKRSVWNQVGGMNEQLKVAFNDVDYCLRVREKGYLVIFTPYAELYHYESKSRGYEDTREKKKRYKNEYLMLQSRWKDIIFKKGDPYYNPNLTLYREDFSLK